MSRTLAILLPIIFVGIACKVNYSFTGTSIPPNVKTISIDFFQSYAPLAPPTLSQDFTEALKDIFVGQTSLELIDNFGDLQFSGEITKYNITPVAITGDETTAQNRLTIGVRVQFVNEKEDDKDFDREFIRYQDFSSTVNLSDVERELNEDIIEQLVQEIFNNSVSDW